MPWGRKPQCGACGECDRCKRAAYMRDWYARRSLEERRALTLQRNPDLVRQRDRERYHRKKTDPEFQRRRRATQLLNYAIRRGEIERGPCEQCGTEKAQGHHDNYDRPYDVRWLCAPCHAEEHRTWQEAA